MKMNDLEMCLAIAELDGVNAFIISDGDKKSTCTGMINEPYIAEYNPITDLALNCALRDKYDVEVDYVDSCVYIRTNEYPYDSWVEFNSKQEINSAVIKCILKANGKYTK
jgi:hypothetical protein